MRGVVSLIAATALAVAAGCSEKPQELSDADKAGHPAWQGTGAPDYTAPGWKAGDQASWDEQLRQRAQKQNEYVRIQSGG